MDIKELVVVFGMLITSGISVLALYKAFKVTPKEIKSADVDLSTKYADLAERSLERAEEMEKQVEMYKTEIKALKERVAQQEIEINELRKKLSEQDRELNKLRKLVESKAS